VEHYKPKFVNIAELLNSVTRPQTNSQAVKSRTGQLAV